MSEPLNADNISAAVAAKRGTPPQRGGEPLLGRMLSNRTADNGDVVAWWDCRKPRKNGVAPRPPAHKHGSKNSR